MKLVLVVAQASVSGPVRELSARWSTAREGKPWFTAHASTSGPERLLELRLLQEAQRGGVSSCTRNKAALGGWGRMWSRGAAAALSAAAASLLQQGNLRPLHVTAAALCPSLTELLQGLTAW